MRSEQEIGTEHVKSLLCVWHDSDYFIITCHYDITVFEMAANVVRFMLW